MATAAPSTLNVREYLPKGPTGMDFVRRSIALGVAHGDLNQARNIARERWGEKTAIPAVTADDVSGGGLDTAAIEFFNAVLERSAIGQTPGLRRRPANTRFLRNITDVVGHWVGEGKPIPVLPFTFEQSRIGLLKVANIGVFTDEMLRSTDPKVEAQIRLDMIDGLAIAIDEAFLDPANSGSAGVMPASITNGLTPVAVAGGTLDDFRDGISTLIANFDGDLTRAVFYGRPELFAMLHSQGYDTVGLRGGELVGAPAIATKALPDADGYYQLILADPGSIAYLDEPSKTEVVASNEAAIQLLDNPTNDGVTPTATNLVSLYQCNSTAIKALAYANWEVEREGAVAIMAALPVADVS